ncbi:MAG: aminomethyl-transferring glycine dehydrogenase [Bacteroidetes bacterium]|nr:aminomethyl-transferring glycine dehydrogenase [Bacteroidota bacterium]
MDILHNQSTEFSSRHIGTINQTQEMLSVIGEKDIPSLIDKSVPGTIRMERQLNVPSAMTEYAYLQHIRTIAQQNQVWKTYIGQGYYNTITPAVILRNIFENPGWYTQYTPYQAEISQGRLESLLNFQTMVADLTGLPIANASLLDEATAAAEAMTMFFNSLNKQEHIERPRFFVDQEVFPQTKDLLRTRALPIQIELVEGDHKTAILDHTFFGALLQYPNNKGAVVDYQAFIQKAHAQGAFVVMATDLLALTLLTSPGELGADAAIGSAQRLGVPLGYGGPHAAFFATRDEFKRNIPGRIIGVSIDAKGKRALRMALQTREQHIKREKATSNICTAQALLANMAALYAVYHGPDGLKNIATRITTLTRLVAEALKERGYNLITAYYFDTITVQTDRIAAIRAKAEAQHINLRYPGPDLITLSLDETTSLEDLYDLINCFEDDIQPVSFSLDKSQTVSNWPDTLNRTSTYLTQAVFNMHRSESQLMRYIKQLENKDLSLNTSMISLGSCTMKLNAASEMIPLSWPEWNSLHPFIPKEQAKGYHLVMEELSQHLCDITAFDACCLQPNSGAQGEYAGLLTLRAYHTAQGNAHRDVMLIPISSHGTNPASAVMVGMKVVVVKALANGYIDLDDLRQKAETHSNQLAGIMITYPSTYGIFEETVKEINSIIHLHGGQVYMDGANMNAQVGLTAPGLIGADVCHLNLHKTFAIPHGGGGPGMGPICVKEHLKPYLPGHIIEGTANAVSGAPYGSALILLISYAYIRMLGAAGLKEATEYAILNANYMRARLASHYDILFTNQNGQCAHEFIVDLRPFKKSAEIEAEDVAKRLMDYGFHSPTMSFPVAGTIMIEPTESEDKAELDRFCDAMIAIREEIRAIEEGKADSKDNLLKNAPHTQAIVMADQWPHTYTRMEAAFPLPYVMHNKFWPSVSRVNNTHGDRNLICTCEPMENYL